MTTERELAEVLAPCPFCGGQPKLTELVTGAVWSLRCMNVLHSAGVMSWKSPGDARERWNDRPALLSRADGGEDSARLDWLEANCVNVADENGTGSQLYLGTYATAPLREAISAAMAKERGE